MWNKIKSLFGFKPTKAEAQQILKIVERLDEVKAAGEDDLLNLSDSIADQGSDIGSSLIEGTIGAERKSNSLKILEWNSLEQEISKFDIIINATSLGLKNGEDFQFNFDNVKDNLIYIDTIYNPMETKTLRFLKENKIKTFNGLDMFIYQGQKSFYLWNKINPEIDQKLIDLLISKLK